MVCTINPSFVHIPVSRGGLIAPEFVIITGTTFKGLSPCISAMIFFTGKLTLTWPSSSLVSLFTSSIPFSIRDASFGFSSS